MNQLNIVHYSFVRITSHAVGILKEVSLESGKYAEVCGVLGGHYTQSAYEAVVTAVYPLVNLSLRNHSFAVDIEEFCRKCDAIVDAGLVPLALYHSHPDGSTTPSYRDMKLPWLTNIPSLILAWNLGKLDFVCYSVIDGKTVSIAVSPDHDLSDQVYIR